jgi:hypothetical protein
VRVGDFENCADARRESDDRHLCAVALRVGEVRHDHAQPGGTRRALCNRNMVLRVNRPLSLKKSNRLRGRGSPFDVHLLHSSNRSENSAELCECYVTGASKGSGLRSFGAGRSVREFARRIFEACASSPGRNSRGAARAGFGSRARRAQEVDAGRPRRRATKLSGQTVPSQRVATAPGSGFVAAPRRLPGGVRNAAHGSCAPGC